MPEGDSVWRLARRLRALEGREIIASELRVPRYATVSLTGRTITRVWSHGKHLLWDCSGLVLHTHLRMDGTWDVHAAGQRWRHPGHTARVVIQVSGGVELVGHELGLVEVWPLAELDERLGWLGPDPLAEDWKTPGRWVPTGRDEAIRRVSGQANRTIGEALLDQRNLAGIGNEYRAEVCFLSGFQPTVLVGDVDVAQVVDKSATLLLANLDSPVRTFTGDHRRGHTTYVFGRAHRPCRRCGTMIEKSTLGGATSVADPEAGRERIIWWCPRCQRPPRRG